MSKLEKLIKEKCKNGVEYVSIGSLIQRLREKGKSDKTITCVYSVSNKLGLVSSSDYHEFKVASDNTSNYYIIKKGQFAYNPARLNIGSIAYLENDEPGLVSPMYIVFKIDESRIMKEYLFLLLNSEKVMHDIISNTEEGARFRFNFERWNNIIIPLPELEVQKEIVDILNCFTSLYKELNNELELRKEQYEYYRDKLLDFKDDKDVRYFDIDEVFDIRNGYTPSKKKQEYWENGNIPWFRMEDIRTNGNILDDSIQHVTKEGIKKEVFPKNSIIVATSATIGEHALIKTDFICNQRFVSLTLKDKYKDNNIMFYYYYFYIIDEKIKEMANDSGTFKSVSTSQIKNLKVPIPSLDVQNKIVSILDTFSSLVEDITCGLPAEIALRKEQYEYYRDKLLEF